MSENLADRPCAVCYHMFKIEDLRDTTCIDCIEDELEALRNQVAVLEANPQAGTCCICGSAIWHREARMIDERGMFHPICAIRVERDGLKEAGREMEKALELACIGSCKCQTKTPDPKYHSKTCRYKHYAVALANYRALDTKAQPNGNGTEMNSAT